MKQLSIVILLMLLCSKITAQKVTLENLKTSTLTHHKAIIKQALTYYDTYTAINSMHSIIALEGVNSTYKDSLAITYFNIGNYTSSHLLAKELLNSKPDNLQLLGINAVSLQNLNLTKEAIEAYGILFAKTKNMVHGYQLTMLQYGIKRLAEAQVSINQTLQCEAVENAYTQAVVDETKTQNIPLKAAAYNLKGLIAFELKDNQAAKLSFEEALGVFPEFKLAQTNLAALSILPKSTEETKIDDARKSEEKN